MWLGMYGLLDGIHEDCAWIEVFSQLYNDIY